MSDLPAGWATCSLGDFIVLNYGRSLPAKSRTSGAVPVYGSNGAVGLHDAPLTKGPTIIVGRKGSIGEVHVSQLPCYPIDTTYYIDEFWGCPTRLVELMLKSLRLTELNRASAVPGLNREDAYALPLKLPPLAEQRRIVAKLDQVMARTARARAELARIPALIAHHKRAILAAAMSGKLTSELRAAGQQTEKLPLDWVESSVGDVADNHDGRRVPLRSSDRSSRQGAFPYFGASGQIDTIDDYLFDGDFVLVSEDGANLLARSTAVAFCVSGKFWVNNHAHVLEARSVTTNKWIEHFFASIDLSPHVSGSAQPKLNQANLNRIRIPLPPLQEQREIVRRIESAFAWLDKVAHEHAQATRLLDHLDQALLAKAFRGELVAQNPADEPAATLLARIRAERETAAPPARRRKAQA